ncbi:hypothetical protein NDU88_001508 [Pleurodeles waltl]|uniref:Syntaxin 6/10/61 N-terminal domain-containing protein n=1 Tax=Pleurodeles waltl TaxID=8319 RepID=A0AAV7S955_PLEWA|nr:hypothetical protein NDU88_001508 [Pleurodeles waltl]
MSLEDPFFVVKGEVQKAVNTSRGLYQRWYELLQETHVVSKEEFDWTTNELRNSLRSIEWDLEDLEETIDILNVYDWLEFDTFGAGAHRVFRFFFCLPLVVTVNLLPSIMLVCMYLVLKMINIPKTPSSLRCPKSKSLVLFKRLEA